MAMNNEATDLLPDLSQELAEMGRGSLQRRIMRLEQELKAAYDRIRELEAKGCSGT